MTEQRRDDRVNDAAVDAAWRHAASEQPSAATDAAILAAARAAVQRDTHVRQAVRPRRRSANWQPLAAAAGVIGLSFLLVQMLPRERLAPPPAPQEKSQSAERGSPPASPEPAAVRPTVQPPAAPAASADNEAAADNAAATDSAAAALKSEERDATAGVAPRAAMEASARPSTAAEAETPEAWASRIAALHDAGDLAAAEAELRAFRAAHPDADAFLPEALRPWAHSVARGSTP